MGGTVIEYLEFLSFLTIFHALCEFNGNYRQYLKFELQVCDSLAPKIYKNHKNVVYHDSTQLHRKKLENAPIRYEWSHRRFWLCFEKNHINGE